MNARFVNVTEKACSKFKKKLFVKPQENNSLEIAKTFIQILRE